MKKFLKSLMCLTLFLGLTTMAAARPDSSTSKEKSTLKNELGFDQNEAYISDLSGFWTNSSLYYYRQTQVGKVGARANYAHRYGTTGKQFVLEAYPIFSPKAYASVILGYANTTQILFPNLLYRVDGYFNQANGIEWSLGQGGQKYIVFSNQKIFVYTASVGKYQGNYFFWFRPYHYTPKNTEFYEVGLRRYFSDENNFLSLTLSAGKLPDIGDLPPFDQMVVINQKGVAVRGQIAVTKNIFFKWGLGYVRQFYPVGLRREITDGNLGISLRF